MDWKTLLGTVTNSLDQELRLRNEYLLAENRLLRQQVRGRLRLTDGDRKELAAIGQQLGRKALEEIATVAKADTILAWNRKFAPPKCDGATLYPSAGRPRMNQEIEDLVLRMARENRSWGYDASWVPWPISAIRSAIKRWVTCSSVMASHPRLSARRP